MCASIYVALCACGARVGLRGDWDGRKLKPRAEFSSLDFQSLCGSQWVRGLAGCPAGWLALLRVPPVLARSTSSTQVVGTYSSR